MRPAHSIALGLAVVACGLSAFPAAASDRHAQRQIQQREQQQAELRLKMQQQRDRAMRSPSSASGDFQRRQLERDQQQRLQQYHEQQSRAMVAPEVAGAPEGTLREAGRQRPVQGGAGQLQRFETERRLQGERSTAPDRAPQQ